MLARDGGELEVHVAPVLPAAGKRRGRARAGQSSRGPREGSRSPPRAFRFVLRVSASLVPSDDELFVGDVERARDVTVVGELHEPRDDGHLCFRSPRRGYRLDDAAVNGARSPRPRPKSLRGKASGGEERAFCITKSILFCGNRSRLSKIYDCSRWEKNAVFPDHQAGALANHTRRSPTTIFRRFRVGASIDAPGTTPPRGIPSTKGRKARRDRPYRLDSLAKGRLSFLPRRTATRVSRTTRRSARGPREGARHLVFWL